MTALALFCVATVVFLAIRDLCFATTRGVEVWLGFEVRGIAALLTAPLHWAIFAFGAWGAWRCRPWFLPCAASYVFYIAVSHLIWNQVSPNGSGWTIGALQALAISIPGVLLWRAHQQTREGIRLGSIQ